jgi:predicted peptidase
MKFTLAFRTALLNCSVVVLLLMAGCKKETHLAGSPASNLPASPYSLTPKSIALTNHCKGFYEYLPEGYTTDAAGTTYPLLIFFHGGGEIGHDSTQLNQLLKHGPLKFVKNGSFPTSFQVNGKTYKFIIIAPQFTSADATYPDEIDYLIEYAKKNYKVDASRIYLSGLSFGGGLIWNYVGKSAVYANKIAAIVPVAAYVNENRDEFRVDAGMVHTIISTNLPIWSTHNSGDNVCPLSWINNVYELFNKTNPSPVPQPRLTVFNASGHEGWTKTYSLSFKENNQTIYEWMLQYHR